MKKISIKTERIFSFMLAGAISLLGFTSCEDDPENPDNNMICMYGTPTGYYEIKGSVIDEAGQTVEGAKVIMRHIDGKHAYTVSGDTVVSDSKGNYMLKTTGWPNPTIRMVCKPGSDALEADSIDMSVTFKDLDGLWNSGIAKETVNFTLKFKK